MPDSWTKHKINKELRLSLFNGAAPFVLPIARPRLNAPMRFEAR